MYTRVPDHLREPLLKELKQLRLKSSIKYFPVALVFFSALAALLVFGKGHAFIRLLHDSVLADLSEDRLMVDVIACVVVVTAVILGVLVRQEYRACECQECLYCVNCDAVDRFDDGNCPICQEALTEKAAFFFTTSKDECQILKKWGLHACRFVAPAAEMGGSDDTPPRIQGTN